MVCANTVFQELIFCLWIAPECAKLNVFVQNSQQTPQRHRSACVIPEIYE